MTQLLKANWGSKSHFFYEILRVTDHKLLQRGRVLLVELQGAGVRRSVDCGGHFGVSASRPPCLEAEINSPNPAGRFSNFRPPRFRETQRSLEGRQHRVEEQHARADAGKN